MILLRVLRAGADLFSKTAQDGAAKKDAKKQTPV